MVEIRPESAELGVTSLIETAKAHGHDPLAYLTDVLERLPTTLNRDIERLLPMNWRASGA